MLFRLLLQNGIFFLFKRMIFWGPINWKRFKFGWSGRASRASTPASPGRSPASPRPRRRWRRPRSWRSRRTRSTSGAASWPTGPGEPPAARWPRPPTCPRSWAPTTPSPRGTRARRTTPTPTTWSAASCRRRTAERTSGTRGHCHPLDSAVLGCGGGTGRMAASGASDPRGPSRCPISTAALRGSSD
jgi:hypothetical protein